MTNHFNFSVKTILPSSLTESITQRSARRWQSCQSFSEWIEVLINVNLPLPFLPSAPIYFWYIFPVEHPADVTTKKLLLDKFSHYKPSDKRVKNLATRWRWHTSTILVYITPSLTFLGNMIDCGIGIKCLNHWQVSAPCYLTSKTNTIIGCFWYITIANCWR